MNQNIITQYKINFQNKVEEVVGASKKIDKFPGTINIALTDFLYAWNRAEVINTILIPFIDKGLAGNLSYVDSDISGGGTIAFVSSTSTRLCDKFGDDTSYINPDFELLTPDLKEIVIGWRDFLLSPPANGTKVS